MNNTVVYTAKYHNIPVVKNLRSVFPSIEKLVEHTRDEVGNEGYVVQFADGHMIKIKSDWYLAIHKAKDNLLYERLVVEMILNEKVDDVMPYLIDIDQVRLRKYADEFVQWLSRKIMYDAYFTYGDFTVGQMSRKDWALNRAANFGPFKAVIFRHLDDVINRSHSPQSWRNVLQQGYVKFILDQCNSNSKFASFKKATDLKAQWNVSGIEEEA